ncbi:MAG: argininosuccinate lyase [Candidatus Obscuribacterales bacterium]|nr:argininosuccinate lyase [Candidatus Obscuribacterales bacterium]
MKVLRKGFTKQLDPIVTKFVSSVDDDEALIEFDIKGSLAHATMLETCGLIDSNTYEKIKSGLEQVASQFNSGTGLSADLEDVHMNVEEKLKDLADEAASHLHTGRSRNDQVALDLRLLVIEKCKQLKIKIKSLEKTIVESASKYNDVVMPGYTHLQRAQPVLFAHALLAFFEMLERDQSRFEETEKRASVSPLGAGALAGTSLAIDPAFSAQLLGLASTFKNSIDAISDRDFVLDFLYASSTTSIHLSQIAETLIIWMTSEFGFIKLPDSLTTASSLMPQKKNPDLLELVRSKSGTLIGELINVFVVLKGLPQGYNRDLQDTKPSIIKAFEALSSSLDVLTLVFANLVPDSDATTKAACDKSLFATDLVEYLVGKGMPFRQAHEVISVFAKQSISGGKTLGELGLDDFKQIDASFEADILGKFSPHTSIEAKTSSGSTGYRQVEKALSQAKEMLATKQSEDH